MSSEIISLAFLIAGSLAACVAAIVGMLCLRRIKMPGGVLTVQNTPQLLRAETDVIRSTIELHARGQRQELGQSLKDFQQLTLAAFGTLRDGIDGQVHGFGGRLDQSSKSVDDKVSAISSKLNDDMVQMRSEAVAGRDALRTTIEQKLEQSIVVHADASKLLREELGGNFHRLGTRVSESLSEASTFQNERLQNVTSSVADLTQKLEQAQERLRISVEDRLDAIRQESATKLE
jgi:DNA recombination protein RmuC